MNVIYAPNNIPVSLDSYKIFLAGSIEMGKAIELAKERAARIVKEGKWIQEGEKIKDGN